MIRLKMINLFKYMEWMEIELDNWKLKKDAPDYVKKEWEKYKKIDELKKIDIDIKNKNTP
ncbi:hypothetical protein OSSY52_19780 [Tepiditoga spiralis]|uniref:Uncharacterized protein n=1 Tax=Tepiditoga spiralis TaxID=2108365 RepID=A0A7G1G9Z4_9BACT|nr:hypothetical protein [Tepiditoga spiralis]BBE31837.1 hypothetical protein OSSY52_19780 [Tepiditoga spiralis]